MLKLLPLVVAPLRPLIGPVVSRLGTAGAVWLAAQGVPAETSQQLFVTIGILAGLTFDIVLTVVRKKA